MNKATQGIPTARRRDWSGNGKLVKTEGDELREWGSRFLVPLLGLAAIASVAYLALSSPLALSLSGVSSGVPSSTLSVALVSLVAGLAAALVYLARTYKGLVPGLVFAYNCFVKPVLGVFGGDKKGKAGHQERLEGFYRDQAGGCLPRASERMIQLI